MSSLTIQQKLAQARLLEAEARTLHTKLQEALGTPWFTREYDISVLGPHQSRNGVVDGAAMAVSTWAHWLRLDQNSPSKRDIHMTIESPGGSYIHMFAMYDYLRIMRAAGHKVTMQASGMVQKQAVTLLQGASERIIRPNAMLVLAEHDFGQVRADFVEVEGQMAFTQNLEDHAWRLIEERSGGKLTVDTIKEKCSDGRIWYISAEEALEHGLVDKIGVHIPAWQSAALPAVQYSEDDTPDQRLQKARIRRDFFEAELGELQCQQDETDALNSGTVLFFTDVNEGSVAAAQEVLKTIARRNPGGDIEFLLCSPGGSVVAGFDLIDFMNEIKDAGHKITIKVLGMAASMGGFILQAASEGEREMGENARILIHNMSNVFGGTNSQKAAQRKMMEKLNERSMPFLAAKSSLTPDQMSAKCKHEDWWLPVGEAEEIKFVDRVF